MAHIVKVLVLYYSSYGHIERMANAVAEGARKVPGVQVDIKRVPETIPSDTAQNSNFKLDQPAPIAQVDDLRHYDAIIIGTGTRYGRMSSQMAAFLDRTGPLWVDGALVGKIGAAFTSTGTQHGGQETTLFSIITNLLHLGMIVVGLPYSYKGQTSMKEIAGGAPYGATTITGTHRDEARQPTDMDLEGARFQGGWVAEIATKLCNGSSHNTHNHHASSRPPHHHDRHHGHPHETRHTQHPDTKDE